MHLCGKSEYFLVQGMVCMQSDGTMSERIICFHFWNYWSLDTFIVISNLIKQSSSSSYKLRAAQPDSKAAATAWIQTHELMEVRFCLGSSARLFVIPLSLHACCNMQMWLNVINLSGSGMRKANQSSIPEWSGNHVGARALPRWGLWGRLLNIQATLWLARSLIIQHLVIFGRGLPSCMRTLACQWRSTLWLAGCIIVVGSSRYLDFPQWSWTEGIGNCGGWRR